MNDCQIKTHSLVAGKKAKILGLPEHSFTVNTKLASGHCFKSMYSIIHGREDGKCVPLKYEDLHVAYTHKDEPKITLIYFRKMTALGARCK